MGELLVLHELSEVLEAPPPRRPDAADGHVQLVGDLLVREFTVGHQEPQEALAPRGSLSAANRMALTCSSFSRPASRGSASSSAMR